MSSSQKGPIVDVAVIVVATAALFAWGLFSNRLERAYLTAPIVFIAVGATLAWLDLVQGGHASTRRPGVARVAIAGTRPRRSCERGRLRCRA